MLTITPSSVALIETHSAQSAAIFHQIAAAYGKDRLETLLDLLEDLLKIDRPRGRNG